MRLAVFAAFPQEIRHIAGQFRKIGKNISPRVAVCRSRRGGHEIFVLQTGMGSRNISRDFDFAMEEYRPELIISAGFGGALYEGSSAGDLVRASEIFLISESGRQELPSIRLKNSPGHGYAAELASKLSERLPVNEGIFFTLQSLTEKSVLRQSISGVPFPVCEMESYFFARKCVEKDVPLLAVRAITDRADEEIPREFSGVIGKAGMYSPARAIATLIRNPKLVAQSLKLGRNSYIASRKLGLLVRELTEII